MPNIISTISCVVGFLVAVFGGSLFVQRVLDQYHEVVGETRGLRGAGRIIGIFERTIVVTLVFVEAYGAIGLVLAAKSIARFGQLRHRKFAEYYLIGTLASIAFAIIVGILARIATQRPS